MYCIGLDMFNLKISYTSSRQQPDTLVNFHFFITQSILTEFVHVFFFRCSCMKIPSFTISLSFKVFHLYITFGLITGVGRGLALIPSLTILTRHFRKYIKLAMGLSLAGVGVSGFFWSSIIVTLENTYGWRGALLMMAGIYGQTIILSCLYRPAHTEDSQDATRNTNKEVISDTQVNHSSTTVLDGTESTLACDIREKPPTKSDLKPSIDKEISMDQNVTQTFSYEIGFPIIKDRQHDPKNIFLRSLRLFKNVPFTIYCIHFCIVDFALMIIYAHFGSYVLHIGFSKSDVVHLYITIAIAVTLARILTGLIAGLLNLNSFIVVVVCAMLIGVATLAVPFAESIGLLLVYLGLFGLLISPIIVLCAPILLDLVPSDQLPSAYGITNVMLAPASLIGAPFAGKVFTFRCGPMWEMVF